MLRWPLPSDTGNNIRNWLDFYEDDMSPWVLFSIHIQRPYPKFQKEDCIQPLDSLLFYPQYCTLGWVDIGTGTLVRAILIDNDEKNNQYTF